MTTTIDSGELSSAISKWQVSVTAEGYGTYIYTNSKENTEEVTYERNFNVSVSLWSANKSFLFLRLRPSCKATCSFSSIVQWVVLESNSEQRFPYE